MLDTKLASLAVAAVAAVAAALACGSDHSAPFVGGSDDASVGGSGATGSDLDSSTGREASTGAGGAARSDGSVGSGGTGGTGGAGAFKCTESATQADCAVLCPKLVGAGCLDGPPNAAACQQFCAAQNGNPAWGALMDCAGPDPAIHCDASKMLSFDGCAGPQQCFLDATSATGGTTGSGGAPSSGGTTGSGGTTATGGATAAGGAGGATCTVSNTQADCSVLCPKLVDAGCSDSPPDLASCEQFCTSHNSCPEWGALMDCLGPDPTVICNAAHLMSFAGCLPQYECFTHSTCN